MPFRELLVLVRPPSFHDTVSSNLLQVLLQTSSSSSPPPLHQHHLFNFPLSLDQKIKSLFFLANPSCNLFPLSSDTAPGLICFLSFPHCLFDK